MRRAIGRLLLSLSCYLGLHRRVGYAGLTAFVTWVQTCQAVFFEPLLPARDGGCRRLQRRYDPAVGLALSQRQDETSAKKIPGRKHARLGPSGQIDSLFI